MSRFMRKPVFGVSDQVQHKSGCTATEASNFGFRKFFVCFFVLRLNIPVNNFSVMSGTEPPLPGYYQYFRGVKCGFRK